MATEQNNSQTDEISWLGVWKNQYGSTIEITSQATGRIEGVFETALEDSALYGLKVSATGVCEGDLISFAVTGGKDIKIVVGYTGILRGGKMETMWQMAAGEKLTAEKEGAPAEKKRIEAWQAFVTGADSFEKVD